MRARLFVVTAFLLSRMMLAHAEPADERPPAEKVIAEAEVDADANDAVERPVAIPIESEPLPAYATGAPLRLEPPKSYARQRPSAPLPPSQPLSQARPR